jgi:hypothetical protein
MLTLQSPICLYEWSPRRPTSPPPHTVLQHTYSSLAVSHPYLCPMDREVHMLAYSGDLWEVGS